MGANNEMEETGMMDETVGSHYISFQIDEEEYGVEVVLVQEIVRYQKPTRISSGNPAVKGVINFRGRVIPVLDMHGKLGIPSPEYDEFTVTIVVEVGPKVFGMIVDRVNDILRFSPESIQAVDDEMARDIQTDHLQAIGKTQDRMVLLLDPDKLMSFRDYEKAVEAI